MLAFIFALLGVTALIILGIAVSLYLYNQGVVGKRYVRGLQLVAVDSMDDEAMEEQFYMSGDAMAFETTHYARVGMLVLLGGIVVIGMFVSAGINMLVH